MEMVFDSSTLILLAKIDLLRESAEDISIVIPPKVKEECLLKESLDALLIKTLIAGGKIEVEKAGNQEAVRKLRADFRIEAGEAQALWLGKRLGVPLAVDGAPTIKACKVLGVQFVTAIHFLVNLRARGKLELPLALAKLDALAAYGRYSRKIIEDAAQRLTGGN
jgi:3'-phosphoadenosine 5'-phosphosulfate sulfotransferase